MSENIPGRRLPDWFHVRLNTNKNFTDINSMLAERRLNTVCREARCPNLHECWGTHRTATFMILGDTCTRRCRFCSVKTGLPAPPDPGEPMEIARSARDMGARHVVVTMVDRDDLTDGGAWYMAETVRAIHYTLPDGTVEVLSSDLMGAKHCIETLMESRPEIISHNLETVRRLTPRIRSRSDYDRSLGFLSLAGEIDPDTVVKSSLMLGLGETREEILETMEDLLSAGTRILNLGQYLRPSRRQIPVQRYWHPDEFAALREEALARGFGHCESGPLVRSSYHAGSQYGEYTKRRHPLDSEELQ